MLLSVDVIWRASKLCTYSLSIANEQLFELASLLTLPNCNSLKILKAHLVALRVDLRNFPHHPPSLYFYVLIGIFRSITFSNRNVPITIEKNTPETVIEAVQNTHGTCFIGCSYFKEYIIKALRSLCRNLCWADKDKVCFWVKAYTDTLNTITSNLCHLFNVISHLGNQLL